MPQSCKYCTRHGIDRHALTRIRIQNSSLPQKFTLWKLAVIEMVVALRYLYTKQLPKLFPFQIHSGRGTGPNELLFGSDFAHAPCVATAFKRRIQEGFHDVTRLFGGDKACR